MASAASFYRQYLAGSCSSSDDTDGAHPRGCDERRRDAASEAASTRDWIESRCTNLKEDARGRVVEQVCGIVETSTGSDGVQQPVETASDGGPSASCSGAVEGAGDDCIQNQRGLSKSLTTPAASARDEQHFGPVARFRAWVAHMLFARGFGPDTLVKILIAACVSYAVAMEAILFMRRIRRKTPHR